MRILVGVDGSTASRIATDFVVSRTWPAGTRIRLLCAVEPRLDWTGLAPVANDTTEADRALLSDVLDERAEALRTPSHVVETVLENGRAADLLMAHAAEWMADLIVVGNRGLGAAASAILGSVSAHLVDHAPCPVLVARSPSATRVLLAADGTESSRSIPRILAAWGNAFRGVAIEVLSVASEEDLPARGLPGESSGDVAEYELHREIAEDAAGELRDLGWEAAPVVRTGDPGREIVATGREWGADLIITGSRGLGTIRRFVLGSVAHDVLLHARSSVLVMRGQVPARVREAARVVDPALG